MKTDSFHWSLRAISITMANILLASTFPTCAWPDPLVQNAADARNSQISTMGVDGLSAKAGDRRAPLPVPNGPGLSFSAQPSEAEISASPVFGEALVPNGRTTDEENGALTRALLAFHKRPKPEDDSSLLGFLETYPHSAWEPALLVNLGISRCQAGHFSQAISAWQRAWDLTKMRTEGRIKGVADRALGELARIYGWAGNYEGLEPLLQECSDRDVGGGAAEMVASARRGLWLTKHKLADFKCGQYALQQLLEVNHPEPTLVELLANKTSDKGCSLAELRQLALRSGIQYQMAKRARGSNVPRNCIMHWKLGHYSAVTPVGPARYQILDQGFAQRYGHELCIEQSVLEEESDGYFLIPSGALPVGWSGVTPKEGQGVWGRGACPLGPNTSAYTRNDCRIGGGCPKPKPGLAAYSAHLMMVSLNIQDIPLGYSPPIGPPIELLVTYSQKDIRAESNPNYSNLGPKWTFDWLSYVEDSGSGVPATVVRYVPGGGYLTNVYSPALGTYLPDIDGGILQYTQQGTYELTFPDGSKHVFAQASTPVGARKMFLTAMKDPVGDTLTITYDGRLRISCITDALNRQTCLHYDLPDDVYKITSIVDPFQRIARFDYINYNGTKHLSKITDTIGMQSQFTYSANDFISQMTTPYGTTTFNYAESPDGLKKTLLITGPNATGRECLRYVDSSIVPATDANMPTSTLGLDNTLLNYRNTLHYDRKAMSYINGQVLNSDLEAELDSNWTNATIYHFTHGQQVGGQFYRSGILESLKRPLEYRVWFVYPGQTDPKKADGITLRQPTVVTRLVEDPNGTSAPVSQTHQFSYNRFGLLASYTDPNGRSTVFD